MFRWTRALGAVTIAAPLAGDDMIEPLALSAYGTSVLGRSFREDESAARLWVWSEASGTRVIQNPPGYARCEVNVPAINRSRGFVAGGSCQTETESGAFVWAGQDRLLTLGAADTLGGYVPGYPTAVTADGSVAVGWATNGGSEERAFRWTDAHGLELVELPEGYTSSRLAPSPETMSEDGSVIVGSMSGAAERAGWKDEVSNQLTWRAALP